MLFLIFLAVPLLEIYLLIEVGSMLGAGTTIFLVVFTAVLGAFLVRTQGFSTLSRAQIQLARAQMPTIEIIEGLFLFVAGALLLTPGFFTDSIGFIFLIPPLRRLIIHTIIKRGLWHTLTPRQFKYDDNSDMSRTDSQGNRRNKGKVIDVDYRDIN